MPAAYDLVLDGVFSHIENGRVYFVLSPDDPQYVKSDNQTVFYLSEVYWWKIGCPTAYTMHMNVEEQ